MSVAFVNKEKGMNSDKTLTTLELFSYARKLLLFRNVNQLVSSALVNSVWPVFIWFASTLLLIFIFGCEQEEGKTFQNACSCDDSCRLISLPKKERVDLSVEDVQYDFDITAVYEDKSRTQFWGYSDYEMKFYLFDLQAQDFLDTIPLARNGEHAVPEIFSFQPVTPDSILLHTNHHNQLILLNSKAERLKTWNIEGDLPNGGRADGLYYLSAWKNELSFHYDRAPNEATFFVTNTGFEGSHGVERFFYPQFATLDLNTGKYLSAYGDYPAVYRDEEQSDYRADFPFAVANGETWAVFYSSHCIYIFERDESKRSVCSKSRFLPDQFEWLPRGLRVSERDPKLIPRGEYINIIHDPYRNLFYRVVLHGLPDDTAVNRDWQVRKQSKWSIMILDREGNCLGEALFESSLYDYNQIFPVEEGLLVSLENPYNPDNEEELLSFQLFDLGELPTRGEGSID